MYLEGMEEASIFVHVAVSDISGKVCATYKITCCILSVSNCLKMEKLYTVSKNKTGS